MSGGAPAAPSLFHTDFAANKSSRSKTTPESRLRRFSDEFCYKRAFLQQNYPRIPAPPLLPRALRQNGRLAAKPVPDGGGRECKQAVVLDDDGGGAGGQAVVLDAGGETRRRNLDIKSIRYPKQGTVWGSKPLRLHPSSRK